MLRFIVKTLIAVLARAVAVIVGLVIAFYVQLVSDFRAPIGVQLDDALAKVRELVRALDSFG